MLGIDGPEISRPIRGQGTIVRCDPFPKFADRFAPVIAEPSLRATTIRIDPGSARSPSQSMWMLSASRSDKIATTKSARSSSSPSPGAVFGTESTSTLPLPDLWWPLVHSVFRNERGVEYEISHIRRVVMPINGIRTQAGRLFSSYSTSYRALSSRKTFSSV